MSDSTIKNGQEVIDSLVSENAILKDHLNRCADELAGMIARHNEQDMSNGEWKYDYQTPFEAHEIIFKLSKGAVNISERTEWVSVKEGFPTPEQVLVRFLKPVLGVPTEHYETGYFEHPEPFGKGGKCGWLYWRDDTPIAYPVTHWMPLPKGGDPT